MLYNHAEIMGISFLNIDREVLYNGIIYPKLRQQQKQFFVTANPEIVMLANEQPNYKAIVNQADYILPDGSGIVLASKIMRQPIEERIPGFEVMTHLIGYAEEEELGCYFLGADELVLEEFIKRIKQLHPNLVISGYHHGFFDLDDQQVVDDVKQSKADMVFVALGSPRQEQWIVKHYESFNKGLFMGVGGSFDVIAGKVKRAPKGWIKLNLEWLYRLLQQPFRWKRILKVFHFMFRVAIKRY
ncbi:N-acetylglucosaminyldiphosphoundecaprenol N-acetyl-beta-D-mannosaminyltransferase [Paraliobacillus ryukyuensis]|uniref:N-acetylglucosaminyldiphosphoundecaprenol N-acetyl-beta-D-mannosaminyltransferase n=1 Tax=Paraliobacillus ryukyuensis TaxID=200904 RepID=A0A366EDX8_9BACI|nr:WecB/TagA/CpsF family glycosyltransferase [Paraliobacillus ryukyuensis]RBP00592.1 N-acetylglucosaminyldiphosphoundecaprenol N-acetyl-beta-D-mannosaminyltransferase [Paraliobacillus ryukyuensis]